MNMQSAEIKNKAQKYTFIKGLDIRTGSSSQEINAFYIGGNGESLNEYPHSFKSRCTQNRDITQAINSLQQLQNSGKCSIQAIFIDVPVNINQLKSFRNYLTNSPFLTVPVFYISNSLSKEDKQKIFSLQFVDDIITLSKDLFTLRERLHFIARVKYDIYIRENKIQVEYKFSNIRGFKSVFKRMTDIVLAATLLLFLSPLLLIIALAIHLDSSGPVFYNSYRAGRGYRIFKFYKFRTMKVGAERMVMSYSHMNTYYKNKQSIFFKLENDPRVTRIGTFLRNTSLDELPQLINVLKGDMSLVGNRPLPLYEASTLTTDEWAERFVAPAGITGLWQIRKRGRDEMSVEERIHLDIAYARHNNLMMDFWIMAQTPRVLFQSQNC
jgi:lipopolysaccharide/colanic/teichoic acid biosynthesis glycosyltransferase